MQLNAESQLLAIRALCTAMVQAVDAAGPAGASGGLLYALLMPQGCTLPQFNGLVSGMIGAGMLCRVGECYHLGELGLEMVKGGQGA